MLQQTFTSGSSATFKNMMAICSIFTVIAVNAQSKTSQLYIDTSAVQSYEWPTTSVGFPEGSEAETPEVSVVRIDTIPERAFLSYSRSYKSKIQADSAGFTRTDTSFTIRTANFQRTFPAFRICECTASDYLGLIKPLNLFLVGSVDMQNEIAYMQLIDRKTGKALEVPTNFDQGRQEVLLSPENTFLLSYSNTYYEHDNCEIFLLKVNTNQQAKSFALDNYLNINFDRLNIGALAWIDERSFAISVTEELKPDDNQDQKIKYYLKITF